MTKQVSCENNRMVTGITVLQVAVEIMNVKEVDRWNTHLVWIAVRWQVIFSLKHVDELGMLETQGEDKRWGLNRET